jgi:tight adherence protein C
MAMLTTTQLTLLAVFASVALLSGTIASLVLNRTTAGRRRLQEVLEVPRSTVLPEIVPLTSEEPDGVWGSITGLMVHKGKKDIARLRQRLLRAGVRHPGAPALVSLAELILPVALGSAVYFSDLLQPSTVWLAVAAAVGLGFFLPGLWIERRLAARRRQIEDGLPDALDLLVVCIEAGAGLDNAILKTSEEIAFTYPALGDELRILNSEIRAGKPRIEAFKNLATRTKVDDVRSLVAMLIQTDRFGTSIGQALRSHADTSRIKRRQRAEEAAQKLGVKLVFPLVLFFFPAFYVVVLGPAVIQFVHAFK